MKYAFVNGERKEAAKGLRGLCPACGEEMHAKCGEVRVHHWAHLKKENCDSWWERESEWHREWKDQFPKSWQEVVQFDTESGEKHIADIQTPEGWVIEFQHSSIDPEERRSRNDFYEKLIWVVDGALKKTDLKQLIECLGNSETEKVISNPKIFRVKNLNKFGLLKEWSGDSLVLFDFSNDDETKDAPIWFLLPIKSDYAAYLTPLRHSLFIRVVRRNRIHKVLSETIEPLIDDLQKLENERIDKLLLSRQKGNDLVSSRPQRINSLYDDIEIADQKLRARDLVQFECCICSEKWEAIFQSNSPCPKCKTHLYRAVVKYL